MQNTQCAPVIVSTRKSKLLAYYSDNYYCFCYRTFIYNFVIVEARFPNFLAMETENSSQITATNLLWTWLWTASSVLFQEIFHQLFVCISCFTIQTTRLAHHSFLNWIIITALDDCKLRGFLICNFRNYPVTLSLVGVNNLSTPVL
jgi:hypothetical protein